MLTYLLAGWAASLGETWLLVEPSVILIMVVLPRLLDAAMTPASAKGKGEQGEMPAGKRTRVRSTQQEALFKSKKSSAKYVAPRPP